MLVGIQSKTYEYRDSIKNQQITISDETLYYYQQFMQYFFLLPSNANSTFQDYQNYEYPKYIFYGVWGCSNIYNSTFFIAFIDTILIFCQSLPIGRQMQNLRKIQHRNEERIFKKASITSHFVEKRPEDLQSRSIKMSIMNEIPQSQLFHIKNLDNNSTQIITNQEQAQKLLQNLDTLQLSESTNLKNSFWMEYLTQYQQEQEQFLEACYQGNVKKVKKVLASHNKHPIDPRIAVTNEGHNGIHLAVLNGSYKNIQIIQLLVRYNVDIDGRTLLQGRTPLILASIVCNIKALKKLLELGAEINLRDLDGNSALHYAYNYDHLDIVNILIQNKADQTLKNEAQKIPKQLSARLNKQKQRMNDTPIIQENQSGQQFTQMKQSEKISESMTEERVLQAQKQIKSQLQNGSLLKTSTISRTSLKDFKKISLLGKGSFGQVYLAKNEKNNKLYAIKCLSKEMVLNHNILSYAMIQRKVLSTINHPFIVRLHYAFQNAQRLFLVMDFCSGGDLLRLIKNKGAIEEESLRKYVCQIILAIQQLHKAEIIYRDLKPGNVVIDKDGHACLADFGLCKEGSVANSFCGSTAYLAPQMIWRKGHTKVIDWYLLGVLIYQCLTGKPPFWHPNKQQLFNNIRGGRYKPLPQQISQDLQDLVSKLLNNNPKKRLGANGPQQIRKHKWFAGVNWKQVRERKQQMPSINKMKGKALKQSNLFEMIDEDINRVDGWQYRGSVVNPGLDIMK